MSRAPFLYGTLIKKLRDECPTFARRVSGTAKFNEIANDDTDIPLPHAFVMPLVERAQARTNMGRAQKVVETFAVVICVNNATQLVDGVGVVASDVLKTLRQEVFDALLSDLQQPNHRGMEFVGSRHITMNKARLWHQFEFNVEYYVDSRKPAQGDETPLKDLPGFVDLYIGSGITGAERLDSDVEQRPRRAVVSCEP